MILSAHPYRNVTCNGPVGGQGWELALGLGALTGCFGADVWLLAAIGASLLIGLVARLGWSATTVPHGPSMCAASAAAL